MKRLGMRLALVLVTVSFIGGCMKFDGQTMKRPNSSSDAVAGRLGKKKPSAQAPENSPSNAMIGSAATPTISVTQPLLGIYSLQALIDFDALDGAAVDPATGTVSLFGHKQNSSHVLPVPYLDYLATAMESQSPIFSLEWTPASQRQVDRALETPDSELVQKLGNLFDANGRLTPIGEWWLKQGGAQVKAGMTRYEANSQVFASLGRTQEAQALALIGARDEALNRGEKGQEEFEQLARVLGLYDTILDYAQRYRAGQITQTQLMDAVMPLYIGGIAQVFGQDSNTYIQRYRSLRSRGYDFDAALNQTVAQIVTPENQKQWLRTAYEALFRNFSEIHVPPVIMKQILGVEPRVRPVFTGFSPTSLLAHTAFEADVFCKSLPDNPDLKKRVPQYRTYFEWRRTKDRAPATQGHTWISPGTFEIIESPNGNAMRFGIFKMKFNLEKYSGRQSVADPLLTEYAEELSARYDEIAREYPILQQMREAMKTIVVAEWLKKHGVKLRFPAEGRGSWNPPAEYPGVIHMAIAVKSGPVGSIITAAGGVDMRVEDWWNLRTGDFREVPVVNMTVPSLKHPNDELNKVYRTLKIVEPPSPARDLPGWVAQARGGQQALQYVSLKQNEVSQKTDSVEVLLQLEKVKKKAAMLDYYDRIINAQTKERMEAMQEMSRLKEESDKKQQELLEEARELAFSLLLNLRKLDWANAPVLTQEKRNAEHFLETVEDLAKIKDLANGLLEEIERARQGKSDPDRLLKTTRELTDDAITVRKVLMPNSPDWVREGGAVAARPGLRVGQSPEWIRAEDVATKSSVVAGVTFAAISIEMKSFEYIDLSKANAQIADALGDRAKELKDVQRMRERFVQEYNVEKRKLEAMMNP